MFYVICSKCKSDLVRVFRSFLNKIQLLGYNVRVLRIDNDYVFLGSDFQSVCQEFNIVVQRSAPYRHHQLGRMERQWRTLSDTTIALMDDSQLDKRFWGHAFLTAVYTRNRVWSQGSKCIPYEAVFGKLPDLSNLRVFGCQVFSHIDKSRQHKLSPKATKGVFDGYASDCPAWLIYNPTTRSITRTNSAAFNEH